MPRPDRASGGAVEGTTGTQRVRFDKWLWAARFYRTRALAADAIDAGQARLNDERVKPAHPVRPGDRVDIRKERMLWTVDVTDVTDRRGSADDAATLYAERPESRSAREEDALRARAANAAAPRFAGRPTKRQRRKLEDFLNEP
jgi:ribosome-associated heat shock protein Hsp15